MAVLMMYLLISASSLKSDPQRTFDDAICRHVCDPPSPPFPSSAASSLIQNHALPALANCRTVHGASARTMLKIETAQLKVMEHLFSERLMLY